MSVVTLPPNAWAQAVSVEKPKPCQHLNIEQTSQSIKGRYSISPFSEDVRPPKFDMPKANITNTTSSSATFQTSSSAVNVTVWIHDQDGEQIVRKPKETKPGKPVSVMARSSMGNVKIDVPQYTCPQPLYMRAKTHNGSILVHIPPTFSGLLSWQCESGTFKLSKSVQERYTPLGDSKKHRGIGKIRVADWVQAGEERGDSAELITVHGSLMLFEASEPSDPSKCVVL